MSKKFWLKRVALQKSPGFTLGSFPPVKQLGPCLNVVWGPNAVGKSSLARAMRALIWDTKPSGEVSAEAEGFLEGLDHSWNLSLSQGRLRQVRLSDNQELELPGRNDELRESYWFPLHELLQEDGGHAATFLQQVRTRMQGGIDLDASRDAAGGISSFARSTTTLAKQAKAANEKLVSVVAKQGEHQDIQHKIETLQREVDGAKELSFRKTLLEDARFLLDKRDLIREQEYELSLYSPSISLIDKHSSKRLHEIKESRQKAAEDLHSYTQRERELLLRFEACSIETSLLQDGDKPARIANRYDSYKELLALQKTRELEYAKGKRMLEEWEAQHAWLVGDPPEEATLKGYIHSLQEIAEICEPLRCKLDADKRLLDALGSLEESGPPVRDLFQAQYTLSNWIESFLRLQGSTKTKALRPGARAWLLALVLVIGVSTSALGFFLHPLFLGAGTLLMLISILLLVPSSAKGSGYARSEEELRIAESEAEKALSLLGKEGPSAWSVESCQALIHELGAAIVSSQERELLNQRRRVAFDHVQASQEKLQQWLLKWQDAARALGLYAGEASLEGAQFFHFANRLETWSALRLEYVRLQEALALAQEDTNRALALLQEELDTTETELSLLKAMGDGLINRFRDAQMLQKELASNAEDVRSLQLALKGWESSLLEFWESIGLEEGNEAVLAELVSDLDGWDSLNHKVGYNKVLYTEKAEARPDALAMSLSHSAADLEAEEQRVQQQQVALEETRETLGGLKTLLETLMFGSDLALAQLEQSEATSELEAFREEQVMAMMITSLASELKEESEQRFQPQVLTHASEWLSRITNHRYALLANNQGFFAKDSLLAKTFTLDELSSGTRIQLLFSIRMAFISMQEESSDVHLPIFLDELLANSDDERALAIAEAIGKIAEQRQVFYFTAQRDEVEKLKTIATSAVTEIPLGEMSTAYKAAMHPLKPVTFETAQVPLPVEDYQEYAHLLSVAGPSLWEPIESLHSWHLLNDSEALYHYLQKGWRHVGQLASALSLANPVLLERIKMLKKAQELAQRGRCRILQIQDLDDPALGLKRSAQYWNQIEEAIGQGITGNALLEAVEEKRIQRFSEANQEILSNWLSEHGFASELQAHTEREIMERLFVAFEELLVGSEDERVVGRWIAGVLQHEQGS